MKPLLHEGKQVPHTYIERNEWGYTVIRLYETRIMWILNVEGTLMVTFDCAQHKTALTKMQLNLIAEIFQIPYHISQRKGVWMITYTKNNRIMAFDPHGRYTFYKEGGMHYDEY